MVCDEVENCPGQLTNLLGGLLNLNQKVGVGDLQQDLLPIRRVLGIKHADSSPSFQRAHVRHDEINAVMVRSACSQVDESLTRDRHRP